MHLSHKSLASLCKRTVAAVMSVTMLTGMMAAGAVNDLPVSDEMEQVPFEATTFSLTESARSMNFNDDWLFELNGQEASAKNFDDNTWRKLSLPHDWSIERDFTHDVSSEIGHLPGGTGWYRKHFTLPAEFAGKRINIDFDGVYMDSHIYVNGQPVGNYPNGYLPFSFDITDYVTCDGKTENVIAVKVTNITGKDKVENQSSRWYSGSGIYRDVHMTVTDPVHVAQYGTSFYTNDIAKEYAGDKNITIDATTTVENETEADVDVVVQHTIYDYNSDNVFHGPVVSSAQQIKAKNKADIVQKFQVNNPKLWSVDNPNLYTIKTEVLVGGAVRDTYETRFGFTWSEFHKDNGFTLNGQPMKLHGVCMHHDQGALGAVDNTAAMRRQMQIMKDMGVNSIRVTHNPASPDLLRICDELGLTVIEEAFDTWFDGKKNFDYHQFFEKACTYPGVAEGTTWAKFDLQQMIRSNRNYPSIIMWSLGNEIWETAKPKGVETVKDLIKWAKEIDESHPVTMGEDKFRTTPNGTIADNFIKVANELDVVGMNYAEDNYEYYHKQFPKWIIYGSETSSAIKSRGYYAYPDRNRKDNSDHAHNAAEYQLSSYDNSAVPWGKTASDSWIPDRNREWIQGEYIWTGFDYIGEPTPWNQSYPADPKSSYFGIVDTAGFPKDDYYLYQSQWLKADKNPMVHIFPHWNWENEEMRNKVQRQNGKIPVRVYSNAPKVQLFINDQPLEEKAFFVKDGHQQQSEQSNRLYLEWEIPWDDVNSKVGTTIEAKAMDSTGKVIATDKVVTADKAAKIAMKTNRTVIDADGYDVAHIEIDMLDKNGNFVPTAMNEMNFRVSGNGKIVGVDNGDPASWERYKDYNGIWKRKAFNGKAVVIVQSTKDEGSFTLTAQGAGLESGSITVYTSADEVEGDKILGYETQNIVTDIGVVPTLPTKVKAVHANGKTTEVGVKWDTVTEEQVKQPAEIIVNGTIEGTGEAVTMKIIVRGPSGVRPVSAVTLINEQPTLPTDVTVIWSDGTTETKQIDKWADIPTDKLATPGQFTITGTVKDSTLLATANIRVVAEAEKSNIALSSFGTQVAVSYEEGTHYPSQLIDGNLTSENGWGNWEKTSRKKDDATLTFKQEYTIDSVNIRISEKKSWQKPDRITVQYWDAQKKDFVNVANQSNTNSFIGWTDDLVEYNGNEITFTPVTTSKLKFIFEIDNYSSNKDMMKIIELQAFSKVLMPSNDAKLTDLRVNDVQIEGFDPNETGYFIVTDFKDKIPVVTATAGNNASVFIRQPLSNDGTAVIDVTSEDGRVTTTYTIQFSRRDAQLESVVVNVPSEVKEDDRVKLNAQGTLQNGHTIPNSKVTVSYAVTDGTGHAAIDKDELLAYTAGTVSVTATMSYLGKEVTSAPVEVMIASNPNKNQIVSFDPVSVDTVPNEAPKLPERVTAHYDNNGLPRELEVTWDTIDPKLYAENNTFTIQGRVAEPSTVQPTAQINVVDAVAAENITIPIPDGYEVVLPKQTMVYFSDGTKKMLDVEWDIPETVDEPVEPMMPEEPEQVLPEEQLPSEPADPVPSDPTDSVPAEPTEQQPAESTEQVPNQQADEVPAAPENAEPTESTPSVENIAGSDKEMLGVQMDSSVDLTALGTETVYHGTVTYAGDKIPVTATTRVTQAEQSPNYVIMRNGYDLPVGIASYTNDKDASSKDSARNLNDGKKDFTVSPDKLVWCNWMSGAQQRSEDWVSVTIANEGVRDARVVDKISVGFFDEKNPNSGISVPEEYWVEYYTGPMDYEMKDLNQSGNVEEFGDTHPLNNKDNWKEVSYKDGKKPAVSDGTTMLDVEFSPVKTHLVRVRMKAKNGHCLGVNELEVYGKTAKGSDTFNVSGITVGGADRTNDFVDKTLAVDLAGAAFPVVAATASDNAAVTIIPASVQHPVTTVRFVPESGKETAIVEYKVNFTGVANPIQSCSVTFDSKGGSVVAGQTIIKGGTATEPEEPTRSGYNFNGWYTADGNKFDFGTVINENVALYAEWSSRGGSSGGSNPEPTPGKPSVSVPDGGGKVEAHQDGSVTITPDVGYHVVDVIVNGVSRGPVTSLTGLDKNDKVVVKFAKDETTTVVPNFGDVQAASWYAPAVNFVVQRGLFQGTSENTFSPNKTMTRGMLVTVLYRLAGKPAAAAESQFADVGEAYYTDAVDWAVANGIVNGVDDKSFAPNAQISREQMATILYRYASKMQYDVSDSNALTAYGDAAQVSPYAEKAMQWANAAKIVNGTNEMKLNPKGSATRAEVAAILMRFCDKYSL